MYASWQDDDEWQDMPIIRSAEPDASSFGSQPVASSSSTRRASHRYDAPLATASTSVGADHASVNARGTHIDAGQPGEDWREKQSLDELVYTRLELDDDPDEDQVHMKTQFLFDDDKGMTPLSQMQATKTLLTEGQRVAYVALCRLVTMDICQALRKGKHKELEAAAESALNWAHKIMGRLYHHMDIDTSEQKMIEQLVEHGVTADDLVPSLVVTHTVPNPEYDPVAAKAAALEADRVAAEHQAAQEAAAQQRALPPTFEEGDPPPDYAEPAVRASLALTDAPRPLTPTIGKAARRQSAAQVPLPPSPSTPKPPDLEKPALAKRESDNLISPLPNTLPGVSTELTSADETVTLDIRWTVLCDLFLALIADSVYDARSRVLLCRMAEHLGLEWMDVVRFERRLTEAMDIQESVKNSKQDEVLEQRRVKGKSKRYVMMGLATLGGGLVIGLSAGILAPAIGAGLGAAFTTIGVTGTTGFLAGTGGAALITTGGIAAGGGIAVKGMAKRTQHVKTFEFYPLHNNRRVNFYITVPGFMEGKLDDIRLPFSVIDPVMGDFFSLLWEPQTMQDTGNALKILTSEVLTQAGQQVLAMTIMTALMSALQWPVMLTKLGYLIDNPWSNALDRAKAAGAVLADVLKNRSLGVRPVSLVGFSLGARVIFYALKELARAKAFGVVQEVYLMGATVTASRKSWREARGVVCGRFVNAYATNDWILGYLFRATTGGLGTVAGLRPIEQVPDMENVDVTDIVVGHMSYRACMPLILDRIGFKVTALTFDEPDNDPLTGDREVLTPEEEEARREAKKNKGVFKMFRSKSKQNAAQSASLEAAAKASTTAAAAASAPAEEDDDDDLPPREDHASTEYAPSPDTADSTMPNSPREGSEAQFNLDKIRQVLAQGGPATSVDVAQSMRTAPVNGALPARTPTSSEFSFEAAARRNGIDTPETLSFAGQDGSITSTRPSFSVERAPAPTKQTTASNPWS
ncbi:uncharacterized protein L969DRAFT_493762 [Mixia osmundae IAM 14324]|uniref:DUF726 domain protein n=1 Tax=Mixia osmundae (strain CBS 9802 / IAM 14324 / JCM 22182 / KY 12970) TaxID=764103 RepID=G7E111_MIXOS|nr:uncharacterized protein L969DRAFT_493762 [Mixia osmundae IAM 14324]KEI38844.1 hypothetical protein L969DRAFT_493762 [Mixia osmundae IAM 14324]GAA96521.1 hypothetical protein E5Q_03189 [Mixia osmundae IAM 14324]